MKIVLSYLQKLAGTIKRKYNNPPSIAEKLRHIIKYDFWLPVMHNLRKLSNCDMVGPQLFVPFMALRST